MRIIKKYSNRRLYDTVDSRYLNLEELAALIQRGETVKVVQGDADITQQVLLQVVIEIYQGTQLFPPGLLHRTIRAAGQNPAQRVLLQQLSTTLEMLDAQLSRFEQQFSWMSGFGGAPSPAPSAAAAPEPDPAPEPSPAAGASPETPPREAPVDAPSDGEGLDALRARLQALEARLKPEG